MPRSSSPLSSQFDVDLTHYREPAPGIKTYRRHYCTRRHRSYRTLAKCLWPRAVWIAGEGEFALLAWCDRLTVTLWDCQDADCTGTGAGGSQAGGWAPAKSFIDSYGCGHACRGAAGHEVVRLPLPGAALPGVRRRRAR